MGDSIKRRLAVLRSYMQDKGLQAFIIPSSDAHLSEYPASHWEARKWISGFTGSAGTVVVTADKAALWTDSRYFLQAAHELDPDNFTLYKEGLPETPTIYDWLTGELDKGKYVGFDGQVYAARDALNLIQKLNRHGIHVIADYDPFASIWHDRPEIPKNKVYVFPEKYTGELTGAKIARICDAIEKRGAKSLLVASLDTIAWIFNIRGNDVKCNPVAVSYAYISRNETILFIDLSKLSEETSRYLTEQGVTIAGYEDVFDKIKKAFGTICLNTEKISYQLYNNIPVDCDIIDTPSPADWMKSIKNKVEIDGFRRAMEKDGIALVRFLIWLEKAVPRGNVSEIDIPAKLIEFRSLQEGFRGESFDTISGYGPNGAIVHYHVTPESTSQVKTEGLLLIDSGGQYYDGTTDITRTVAVGPLTQQMKEDYTMVLKGHIGIATAKFPRGTRGSQLDILARKALWDNGLNYLHGTGHGIGHFLNVHEGPQSIRMNENPTTLEVGMVTSNEPGLYRSGKYGIRIENLILTKNEMDTEFGTFYSFETLTLCPIDKTPIIKEMLTKTEIEWLNQYHKSVYDRLSPSLTIEEKIWLKGKTDEI